MDLSKLEENLNYLKSKLKPQTKIIAVVKAYAYGHGDLEVSKKLEKLNVFALWVSDFENPYVRQSAAARLRDVNAGRQCPVNHCC